MLLPKGFIFLTILNDGGGSGGYRAGGYDVL